MVRRRDDGRWEGRIVVGHKENGDSIFRYVYADTQKELSNKLRQHIENYKGVELTEKSSMTLAVWLDKWLDEYMAPKVRNSTLNGYRGDMQNHVVPYIGQKLLDKVTASDLRSLYDKLLKDGRITNREKFGAGLSPTTVRSIHTTLHHALKTAAEEGMIPVNPVGQVAPPRLVRKPMQVLNGEQLDRFMSVIETDEVWQDFFHTEMTTGLRRGEICGLRWEDFDDRSGVLSVRRTVHIGKGGKLTVGDTKTYAGTRNITLPRITVKILSERKKSSSCDWIF